MEFVPAIAFGLAATALLALGAVLSRRARAAPVLVPAKGHRRMLSLMRAAAMMREAARREAMVIATVAEKAQGGAAEWFALSIASVVPVYRRNEAGAFAKLEPGEDIGSGSTDLYIRKQDYPAYLRWARSMQ